jgi:peptidoglycan/LPS O-acetylase OafA/YrhL
VNLSALRISPPEGEPRFRFVDALRTISIVWILLLHVTFYSSFFVTPASSATIFGSLAGRWAMRGHFGLDALFVITGFLIGYYVLVDLDRGRYSFGPWLFRRMARLVPAYFTVLVLYHFTMNFNIAYVWANLLFVNNDIPLMHQAMSWSWSLPVDVAFYLTFPLLLVIVRDRPRHLLNALWLVFGALVFVRGYVELAGHFTLPLHVDPAHDTAAFERYFNGMYDKTQTRIGAIVCGLMVVALVRYHGAVEWLQKRPLVATLLAVLCAVVIAGVVAAPVFPGEATEYDPTLSALYLICYNYAFSLGIACLMLLLLAAPALLRPLRATRGWRGWFVPAELCYGVFLLNPFVVLGLYQYVVHEPVVAPWAFAFYAVCATAGAFALAYLLYVCVERPCREWSRHVARRFERPRIVAASPAAGSQPSR